MNTEGKLVRDRIPDIIRASGREPELRHLIGDELVAALGRKLVEEAQEAAGVIGDREQLVDELADVREVLSALMAACGIDDQEVADAAAAKAQERGAFVAGVWLAGVGPRSETHIDETPMRAAGNLTAEQKDELLSAYRMTFDAQRHGEAVKAMYTDFAARFAVDPNALRAAVAEDLRINRELYDGLRKKLLARQAIKNIAKKSPDAAKNRSTPVQPPKAPQPSKLGKTVTCPVCKQVVPGRQNGNPKDHDYNGRPCSGEVATCQKCKLRYPVRASDGRMITHSVGGKKCTGSGRSPYEGRSLKFMHGITGIVSGGLGSAGKRS